MVSAEGPTGWSQHVSGRDLGGSNAPPPWKMGLLMGSGWELAPATTMTTLVETSAR